MLKPDGITDNTIALNQWIKDGGGTLPAGVIRITDSVVVGAIILKDYTNPDSTALDLAAYQYVKGANPVPIRGNDKGTVLWLDNPDKTKPVIAYNAQGIGTNYVRGEVSNITLKGVGIGITSAYVKRLKIDSVNFIGFDNGLILNNAYFIDGNNLFFEKCKRAEYDIRCHRGRFGNITLANCEKGFEVNSNIIKIDGYYASTCKIGLHIAAGNNIIEGCYLETKDKASDVQLIIGKETGSIVNGNVFTSLTISAPYLNAIRFEKTCGNVTITGGECQSTKYQVIGTPKVEAKNFLASLPINIIK